MMTLYCYEELPYSVQQEVDKRVKQTTAYKKYVESFYAERLNECIDNTFDSYELPTKSYPIVVVGSLENLTNYADEWHDIFNRITYNMDNKQISVDITIDETIDFNNLHSFIHTITYNFSKLMQDVINSSISIEPDIEQFLTDKTFTEDGKEVEISFK